MAECRDCKSPITFVKNVASGARFPIDPSPDDQTGTVRVWPSGAEGKRATPHAAILKDDDLTAAEANAELLFVPHRDVCAHNREHNPMPDAVRAFRDSLKTPNAMPRRRRR